MSAVLIDAPAPAVQRLRVNVRVTGRPLRSALIRCLATEPLLPRARVEVLDEAQNQTSKVDVTIVDRDGLVALRRAHLVEATDRLVVILDSMSSHDLAEVVSSQGCYGIVIAGGPIDELRPTANRGRNGTVDGSGHGTGTG